MTNELTSNIKSKNVWLRGFFMLLFAAFYSVSGMVLSVVAVFQFGCTLFTGKPNDNATRFGSCVGQYIYQITRFVTFNTEQKPFPFSPWPEPGQETGPEGGGVAGGDQSSDSAFDPETRGPL